MTKHTSNLLTAYQFYLSLNQPGEAGDMVAAEPQHQRILLREEILKLGLPTVQTLYYDYESQEWFGMDKVTA